LVHFLSSCLSFTFLNPWKAGASLTNPLLAPMLTM
jgi:hypothetical protein